MGFEETKGSAEEAHIHQVDIPETQTFKPGGEAYTLGMESGFYLTKVK